MLSLLSTPATPTLGPKYWLESFKDWNTITIIEAPSDSKKWLSEHPLFASVTTHEKELENGMIVCIFWPCTKTYFVFFSLFPHFFCSFKKPLMFKLYNRSTIFPIYCITISQIIEYYLCYRPTRLMLDRCSKIPWYPIHCIRRPVVDNPAVVLLSFCNVESLLFTSYFHVFSVAVWSCSRVDFVKFRVTVACTYNVAGSHWPTRLSCEVYMPCVN